MDIPDEFLVKFAGQYNAVLIEIILISYTWSAVKMKNQVLLPLRKVELVVG